MPLLEPPADDVEDVEFGELTALPNEERPGPGSCGLPKPNPKPMEGGGCE